MHVFMLPAHVEWQLFVKPTQKHVKSLKCKNLRFKHEVTTADEIFMVLMLYWPDKTLYSSTACKTSQSYQHLNPKQPCLKMPGVTAEMQPYISTEYFQE